jgi:antiviral helicase SKI2
MVVICNKPYPSESPKYQQYFDMFPYELSDFQKYAIEAIVEGQHSLITAHTGSGKSLPAEFAIQFFHQKGKKTIYTSPIKALSNQKYYEFTQKYPHITFGLITGDIKINPTADVLIMTAEILLNCLFVSQPEKMENSATSDTSATFQININTELACVVMDEIHYINDSDRGAVWEKTILLLPPHIQMIMLSATIDSPELFAAWCERGGGGDGEAPQKKVYLSSTNTRIVPLIHYGYLVTTETFYKKVKDKAIQQQMRNSTNRLIPIKDSDGKYNPAAFLELKSVKKLLDTNEIPIKRNYVLNQLCTFLKDRDMFPAIAFVFSRKNVELYAKEITANLLEDDSKIPYIVARECEQILRKLPNYKEYLELPEYIQLVALLEKGVGIHHSGMIPILREIVELMISKRYIKLLFATESFAIGLNCPIRTAIFTSLTKFDGNYDRLLLPHEYNQAASRCGRRGIDTIGHVIHCNNLFDLPTDSEYRELLCGKPQSLISKFCISMPLVLTLLKTPSNITTICEFVEKSMMQMRLIESQTYCIKEIAIVESMIEKQKSSLQFLRTPIEICQEYNRFIVLAPTLVNKKRKEVERNIQQLLCNYKYIKEDSLKINGLSLLEQRLENERENLYTLENFISTKIRIILDLLENNKFVEFVESVESYKEENYTIYLLTKKVKWRLCWQK